LALNQGYGWASNINLGFIFDRIFSVESGCGYPAHRKEPQKASRLKLVTISTLTHRPFAEIIESLPDDVVMPVTEYPGMQELIDVDSIEDPGLKQAFEKRMG
jgi:hypothetical protein